MGFGGKATEAVKWGDMNISTGLRQGELMGLRWGGCRPGSGPASSHLHVAEVRRGVSAGRAEEQDESTDVALPKTAIAALRAQCVASQQFQVSKEVDAGHL